MNKNILGFIGYFLIFLAGFMAIPLIIALAYGEKSSALAFVVTMCIAAVPGLIIRSISRTSLRDSRLRLRHSYLIVSLSWILASVIGCLPFVISGSIPDFIEAVFETASGFTTTGSTILTDIDALPKSVSFWRCLTQWLGGMGIIVLFVALLPDFGIKAQNIAGAETPGPTMTKISSRFAGTARLLYTAYLVLTAALAVLLMLGGMTLYDAVCHSMTAMATGGYSTHGEGIAYFNSPYIYWVFTIFMFIAGTNFNLFFVALHSGPRKAFSDDEFRFYASFTVIAIALVVISLMTNGGYDNFGTALTDAAFQVVTIMTTTGYSTVDYIQWPAFTQMVLIILMFAGGSSSSTAGGIKHVRVLTFFRMIRYEVRRILHNNIVDDIRYNGKKMMPETLTHILTFLTTYMITLIIATLLVSLTGDGNLVSNFTAALTCISNVGPGLDMVGPAFNFHFYSGFSKVVLTLVMIAGRLELATFMLFFTPFFWRPDKA